MLQHDTRPPDLDPASFRDRIEDSLPSAAPKHVAAVFGSAGTTVPTHAVLAPVLVDSGIETQDRATQSLEGGAPAKVDTAIPSQVLDSTSGTEVTKSQSVQKGCDHTLSNNAVKLQRSDAYSYFRIY